ncbi:hypothetical protein ACX0MV_02580 [Pseudomonas borbori]
MQEQRYLPALRSHIDSLLSKGWAIVDRTPLTLQNGRKRYLVMHGMLISDGLLWGQGASAPTSQTADYAAI